MAFVVIENFRAGLDTRRSILTSVLGTLQNAQDCHINPGGEIEKRKAFVGTDITPTLASGVTATYGIEALKDSIVIFGGEVNADIAHWPPAGYTYQALIRNPVADAQVGVCDVDATPNYCAQCSDFSLAVQATGVIHSTAFNGKALVIATMSDGSKAGFYDGTVITDINFFGQVLPDMDTKLKLFCELVKAVNATEVYTADIRDDLTGIVITGEPGREFSINVSATGSLCSGPPTAVFESGTTSTVPSKIASGYFTIEDGEFGRLNPSITSIKVGTGELLLAPVVYTTDAETTAALVVTAINNGGSPYNAKNIGTLVTVYADAGGADDNSKPIKVTTTGKLIIGKCSLAFTGTGFTLEYIKIDNVNVLTAPYVFPTASETLSAFLDRVVANIVGFSGTHGYTALRRSNVVKLSKVVTISDPPATADDSLPVDRGMIPVSVRVTPTVNNTGFVEDADESILRAFIDVTEVLMYYHPTAFIANRSGNTPTAYGTGSTTAAVRAIPTGGTPPYKYTWRVGEVTNMAIVFESAFTDSTQIYDIINPVPGQLFDFSNPFNSSKRANLYLDIIDANGNKASSVGIPFHPSILFT